MKKLIFYSILILVFLASCAPDSEEEANNPQVVVPPDEKITNITVYLDGYEPPAQSRAMNKPYALMNCDYFEVIFLYNGTAVRGQWRIGEKAGVNGVTRDVNYGNVTSPPPAGAGSAILLAGKSDKTLMAIGRLSGTTMITTTTTSVTFAVVAVKAGVNRTLAESSFLTASNSAPLTVSTGNTEIVDEVIASLYFPAFKLPTGIADIRAAYTFKLDHSTVSFSDYAGGLYVSSKGTAYKKQPSYSMSEGGNINGSNAVPILDITDQSTVEIITTNQTTGQQFAPLVQFKFNTTSTEAGSIFALVFQIPIYVLVPECVWYMRPGYGVLNYELDDGTGGLGGAVLIKIGDATEPNVGSNDFYIKIKQRPAKWRYRWTGTNYGGVTASASETGNPSQEYDRVFRIGPIGSYGGLEVQKFDKATNDPLKHFINDATNENGIEDTTSGTTNVIPYNLLTFIIGESELPSTAPGSWVLPDTFYGFIEVTVKHTNSSLVSATDKFYILVSGNYRHNTTGVSGNPPSFSTYNYDYANLTNLNAAVNNTAHPVISASNFQDAFNGSNDPPNIIHIMRLDASFDIPSITINTDPGMSRLYVYVSVAADNNLALGRSGTGDSGTRIQINGDNSGLTAFFFGKWPFAGLPNSPSALADTRNFRVNAGGTYANTNLVVTSSRKMIIDGNVPRGGIYNVDVVEEDVTVNSPLMLH